MTLDPDSVPDGLDLVVVAAVARNGVIGADGEMPWHYPRDLRHFHETTVGAPVILGRVTFESILDQMGEPLAGRVNVVVSETLADRPDRNVAVVDSVPLAVRQAAAVTDDAAYVAGGATVYEQLLPAASRMILTEIPESPPGDAVFPEWDETEWEAVERRSAGDLQFVTYERR